MCFIGWKNPKILHFCSLKSILLSTIHPLQLSFKVCVFYWMKNLKSERFSHLNPFSSVWSMVLVSLAFELQGSYVLLNEKSWKVCALLLNFTLLKLHLELSNFPIYSMNFLYINCTNYLQCLSYPISSLLWLTPLTLAALVSHIKVHCLWLSSHPGVINSLQKCFQQWWNHRYSMPQLPFYRDIRSPTNPQKCIPEWAHRSS